MLVSTFQLPVGLGLLVGDEIHTISVFAAKFIFRKLGVV